MHDHLVTTFHDSSRVGPLNWLLAGVVTFAGMTVALASAGGFMYGSEPGTGRLREVWPSLLMSVLVGLGTLAVARRLIKRRAVSPWLLLGAMPAGIWALNHAGLIGR